MVATGTKMRWANGTDCERNEGPPARRGVFVCLHCRQATGDRLYCGPAGHTVRIEGRQYRAHQICVECFIYSHIPPGYVEREIYIGGNATLRPPLGVEWLDSRGKTLGEAVVLAGRRPRQLGGWQRSR